ncbi:MAG: hypothetical protein WKF40_09850 [Thermoleophilaceae bacterium]
MQGGLVVLDADQQGVAGRGGLREPVLLAMQRVGGEQHAREAKLGHQLRHGCDLVRRPGQLLVRQDQGGVAGEGAEHVDRLAVGQVVEAAAQRLAVERDRAQRLRVCCVRSGRGHGGGTRLRDRHGRVPGTGGASVFTAGARRKQAPKTAFRRSRCRAMKAMIFL